MGFITQILTYKFFWTGRLRLQLNPTVPAHWQTALASKSVLQSKYVAMWVWFDMFVAEKVVFASHYKILFAFWRYRNWRNECRRAISLETCNILFYFSKLLDNIWAWLLVQHQILWMYLFLGQLFKLQYFYYFGCQEGRWEASQTELLMKIVA